MKINRNNYEAFFLDYLEGNLDETFVNDFIEFLQQNPDMKQELSIFEPVSVNPEKITFNQKENLYKEKYDLEKEFDNTAIATLEGDISAEEKIEFEKFLQKNPEKQKDADLFSKTKLLPDETIVFSKKNKLYHKSTVRTILLWTTRVAAVLIVALTFYILVDRPSKTNLPKNQITVVENESTIKETPVEIKEILQKTTEEILVQPGEKVGFKQISTTKEIEHEDFAMLRVPLEIPDRMSRLSASLPTPLPEFSLAKMNLITTESSSPFQEERLLADIVKEKTGLDNFKFNQITKAGLNLVSTISKDKFNYETNEEGKVTELNLDTRLLAFSIPTKNEVAGD